MILGSPSAERGYNLVPAGFGVPLQAYTDFVQHPPNSDIRALIEKLVSDVQGGQLSPKELATRSEEVQHAIMAGSFPPGRAGGDPGQAGRGAAGRGEDQGPVQRQRRGHPELRRRRAARQLRRRHRQARPADRVLPDRGGRRGGRRGQAQGQAEVGGLRGQGRVRQPVEQAGDRGAVLRPDRPDQHRDGAGDRARVRPRVRRSPRTPSSSPGCSTPRTSSATRCPCRRATTWSPTRTRAPTPRSPSPRSSATTSRPA